MTLEKSSYNRLVSSRIYGKGSSRSNLICYAKKNSAFPTCETLFHKLSWSYYLEMNSLLKQME